MDYLNMNEKKLLPVAQELNNLLAEYNIYYQKLRGFHWTVVGRNFFDLHQKFEELYDDARIKIDEVAERILTLQFYPLSQYKEYIKMSNITETAMLMNDSEMVNMIIEDHGILLARMKFVLTKAENAGDDGTIDLLGSYIRDMEKSSWMLSAWTKKTKDLATS